ncbi:uncharacterized protein LOC143858612 [Tasmannia lanceolata]|uniref:uncharacterized protein LOC143858612 n=1 Tax=Tasmannia lanceolata TaxID=3420 RepID=UPI004062C8AA
MKILSLILYLLTLEFLFFFSFTISYRGHEVFTWTPTLAEEYDPSVSNNYARFGEVEKKCASVISLGSELKPDENRKFSIPNELSFSNGDWGQENNGAPLMPFDSSDAPKNDSGFPPPLNLVSFRVMDVDSVHRSKKMVNVSGILNLGISRRNVTSSYSIYSRSPQFQMLPGSSWLSILFEGVYVESERNGGERILCLLGTSILPSRQSDSTDPWEWVKGSNSGYSQPLLLQDDKILLVLHYPKTFTLTSRTVHGEMRSLNQEPNVKYFDKIDVSSQLGPYSIYQFGSEGIVSKACDPYPAQDNLTDNQIEIFKGFGFCGILEQFTSGEAFNVVPNWKCNVTDDYCSKLGPFASGREVRATDGGFKNVKLMIEDVRCEPKFVQNNGSTARVSAIFRAIPPLENQYTATQRSSLTNMTLSAEGIWNSSGGQLCMVGCLNGAADGCNSRICLYVPISFSITQRSIIFGSISSINNETNSYFPLSFERVLHPSELWNRFSTSHLSYKYSKINLAGAFLERSESFYLGAVIKKSLLSYPTLEDGYEQVSLSLLSEDLTLHVSAISDPLPKVPSQRTSIRMEVLSLGPLFGRYWSSQNESSVVGEKQFHAKPKSTEQLLLNVSAELTLSGKPDSNVSVLFLEGLYDPMVGKMYLIGCRDVRASWNILFESMDLEGGLDCLIEVKVEYPPTTALWLMNPTVKISITSQRNEDDPLHFSPINLLTLPILYRRQREDILSRKGVEGILRILTLSVAIACIFSQLFYIRDKVDAVPYISLVMLGVQALGYSLPLITGAEALFSRMASESYETPSYDLENNQKFRAIDYTVKFLVLVAFLLTLRLCQKVWKSRLRLLTRTPLEPDRVPSDRQVCLISLALHAIGFLIILAVHAVNTSKRPLRPELYIDSRGNSHKLREWETQLEEYVGLVQDFFLLPQIIGNFLWQINCEPLRKVYYIGVTVVRLLPHFYDYIKAPVFNPYFSEEYEFVNPNFDFYSKFGDIAIPVFATLLASIVYIQQRWKYRELNQALNSGQRKLLPLGSKIYERLPSKSFEAELVSGVNQTTPDHLEQNDV